MAFTTFTPQLVLSSEKTSLIALSVTPAWYGLRRCVDCGLIRAPTAFACASSAALRGTPPSVDAAAGVFTSPGFGAAAAAAVVDVVEDAPATTGASTLGALLLAPALTSP